MAGQFFILISLFFFGSDFVMADESLLNDLPEGYRVIDPTSKQIRGFYELVLGKEPSPEDMQRAKSFFQSNALPPPTQTAARAIAVERFFNDVVKKQPSLAQLEATLSYLEIQEQMKAAKNRKESKDSDSKQNTGSGSSNNGVVQKGSTGDGPAYFGFPIQGTGSSTSTSNEKVDSPDQMDPSASGRNSDSGDFDRDRLDAALSRLESLKNELRVRSSDPASNRDSKTSKDRVGSLLDKFNQFEPKINSNASKRTATDSTALRDTDTKTLAAINKVNSEKENAKTGFSVAGQPIGQAAVTESNIGTDSTSPIVVSTSGSGGAVTFGAPSIKGSAVASDKILPVLVPGPDNGGTSPGTTSGTPPTSSTPSDLNSPSSTIASQMIAVKAALAVSGPKKVTSFFGSAIRTSVQAYSRLKDRITGRTHQPKLTLSSFSNAMAMESERSPASGTLIAPNANAIAGSDESLDETFKAVQLDGWDALFATLAAAIGMRIFWLLRRRSQRASRAA